MVIDRLFAAILTGLLTFAVSFLKDVADSVNKLNIQMGVVISRMENYDARIEKLEDYNARIKGRSFCGNDGNHWHYHRVDS